MSFHVDLLVIEAETSLLQETRRKFEECRQSGDAKGASEQFFKAIVLANSALEKSATLLQAILDEETRKYGGDGPNQL